MDGGEGGGAKMQSRCFFFGFSLSQCNKFGELSKWKERIARPDCGDDCRFISERSEFEFMGDGHAGTALQNGCGPEQMSGGDAKFGMDEERRCQCRDRSGE